LLNHETPCSLPKNLREHAADTESFLPGRTDAHPTHLNQSLVALMGRQMLEHPASALLAEERPFLLRLALLQLGRRDDAEDVVQETLIAAVKNWAHFAGQAPLRAWLTGILRHKIVDSFRARREHVALDIENESDDEIEDMFLENGSWNPETFVSNHCPQTMEAQRQLLQVVELCLNHLRGNSARLFLMREYLGMELNEVASEAEISEGNLRVILHRARLRLRSCVVRGWGEC
jgi:RNA polymerase sigma-70 factor (ECF subfamily)